MPLCSLVVQPKLASLSSYEDGKFGGDSPRFIRLLGELEYDGTFLAHSLVFCEADWAMAVDDRASNNGDVTGFPFPFPLPLGVEPTGFISGDCTGVADAFAFLFL